MGEIYKRIITDRSTTETIYVFESDLILKVRFSSPPAVLSLDPISIVVPPEIYSLEVKENIGEDFEAEVIGKLEEIIGGNESYWKVEFESGRVLYMPGKEKPKTVKRGEHVSIYPSTPFLSLPKRKTGFEIIEFIEYPCYQASLPTNFSQVSADDLRLRLYQCLSQVYYIGS